MGTYWQNAFPYFHCLCVCGGLLVINMVISSTGSGYMHRSPTPLLWDPLFVWASQSEEGEDSHFFPGKQTTSTLGGSSFYRQCLFLREYYCIMCIFILFSSVFKMLLLLRSLWVCRNKGSNGSCWEMMTQTLCRSKRYSFENNSTWLTLTCSNINFGYKVLLGFIQNVLSDCVYKQMTCTQMLPETSLAEVKMHVKLLLVQAKGCSWCRDFNTVLWMIVLGWIADFEM